jgi:hypothetical protein
VDFLEPQNLFSVAMISPSVSKKRTTGEGPVGGHGGVAWILRRDHERRLVFKKLGEEGSMSSGKRDGCLFVGFEA